MTRNWPWSVTFAVVSVSALLMPSPLPSAEPAVALDPIVAGSRVRLRATSIRGELRGTVMDVNGDALVLRADHRLPLRVSRRDITRLDVSTGRHRRVLRGMAVGGAIGAGALTWVPRESYCGRHRAGEACPTRAQMVGAGIVGGALWGAMVGHFITTDRWSEVPLERVRVRLAPPPGGGGAGLALSIAW